LRAGFRPIAATRPSRRTRRCFYFAGGTGRWDGRRANAHRADAQANLQGPDAVADQGALPLRPHILRRRRELLQPLSSELHPVKVAGQRETFDPDRFVTWTEDRNGP
jgi:hypothetical protein